MSLDADEMQYYLRQIALEEIGREGQLRLKNARVLCIGAGGLGAPLLQYLVAAGVGTVGIMDNDVIEFSNMSRQVIYQYQDIGIKKVIAAKQYLTQLNPFVNIVMYPMHLNPHNASALIADYDIVADCTDNLLNRYVTNQVCFTLNKPFVFAGIWKHQGQCMLFQGKKGPCFHCLFPGGTTEALPDCSGGVMGILPGMLGILQANLVMQQLLGWGDSHAGRLFIFNSRNIMLRHYQVKADLDCFVCNNKSKLSV